MPDSSTRLLILFQGTVSTNPLRNVRLVETPLFTLQQTFHPSLLTK